MRKEKPDRPSLELDDYSGPFVPDLHLSDFSKEGLMKLVEVGGSIYGDVNRQWYKAVAKRFGQVEQVVDVATARACALADLSSHFSDRGGSEESVIVRGRNVDDACGVRRPIAAREVQLHVDEVPCVHLNRALRKRRETLEPVGHCAVFTGKTLQP